MSLKNYDYACFTSYEGQGECGREWTELREYEARDTPSICARCQSADNVRRVWRKVPATLWRHIPGGAGAAKRKGLPEAAEAAKLETESYDYAWDSKERKEMQREIKKITKI